jgi:hypothetical protein
MGVGGGGTNFNYSKKRGVVIFSHFCSNLSIIHLLYRQGDEVWEQVRVSRVPGHEARLDCKGRFEVNTWFFSQFVEIPRGSIIVCFLSLLSNAGLNLSPFEIGPLCP